MGVFNSFAFGAILTAITQAAHLTTPDLNQTYDYIIVGGGTSGLTIANRLTEDGGISKSSFRQYSQLL